MASLMKLGQMPIVQRCILRHFEKNSINFARGISTSKKNSDTAGTTCEPTKTEKNWVSYGFDYTSKEEDTNVHHASYFFSISLCIVVGGFMWAYAPDVHKRDWAQREAFLELRRREEKGLPRIDANYVNPKTVKLPSEAELCDVEIII